tara:strand:+ start:373 stop:738 length:366 start_codon:yes stop_codon:yes gene_type:complete
MNLEYQEELTRLRLRLAEVELQRDAFKAMACHALKELIREVLTEQAKPKPDNVLGKLSVTELLKQREEEYGIADYSHLTTLRQDDRITTTTYSINGKDNVTKEQYEEYLANEHTGSNYPNG